MKFSTEEERLLERIGLFQTAKISGGKKLPNQSIMSTISKIFLVNSEKGLRANPELTNPRPLWQIAKQG